MDNLRSEEACTEEADNKVRIRVVQIVARITLKDFVQHLSSIVIPVGRKDSTTKRS